MLEVSVSDPVRESDGLLSSHVSYKVHSANDSPAFSRNSNVVIRRYSEFAWLRSQLTKACPGAIIPPLPDKGSVASSFDDSFIERRCSDLDVFLKRVSEHSLLNDLPCLRVFLEGDETEFSLAKNTTGSAEDETSEAVEDSWLSGISDAFRSFQESFTGSPKAGGGRGGAAASGEGGEHEDSNEEDDDGYDDEKAESDFVEAKAVVEAYEKRTAALALASHRSVVKERELAQGFAMLSKGFVELSDAPNTINSTETSKAKKMLSRNLRLLGETFESVKHLDHERADVDSVCLETPLVDHARLSKAAREAVSVREKAHAAFLKSKSILDSATRRHRTASSQGNPEQLDKALRALKEAKAVFAKRKLKLREITTRVVAEVARFDNERQAELKRVVLEYVKGRVAHATERERAWTALADKMKKK